MLNNEENSNIKNYRTYQGVRMNLEKQDRKRMRIIDQNKNY